MYNNYSNISTHQLKMQSTYVTLITGDMKYSYIDYMQVQWSMDFEAVQ